MPEDPTKSTLAFATAVGALGAGKEVSIALLGDGAYLAKAEVAKSIHGVGFPPLSQLIEKVVNGKVTVYVWGICGAARGVTGEDLKTLNASFIDAIQFANLAVESSVVTFWLNSYLIHKISPR